LWWPNKTTQWNAWMESETKVRKVKFDNSMDYEFTK
jgi:hypothetical protein